MTSRRVLVVDDDEGIREMLTMALSDEGYEVETAPHGAAALDLLRECQPGLILLDMRMPIMDGWEFARAYRSRPGHQAPIVVVTAARDASDRAQQVQADGYLAKPFSLDELFEVVGRFCERGAGTRASGQQPEREALRTRPS